MRSLFGPLMLLALAGSALAGCAGQTVATPQVQVTQSGDMPYAHISGILRGRSVQVPLTLNNPQREAIHIVAITMRVVEVDEATCPDRSLSVRTYPKPIIGPQASGVVLVTLALDAEAPKACDGTSWKVAFESRAEVTS